MIAQSSPRSKESSGRNFITSSGFILASIGAFTPNKLAQKVIKMIPTPRVAARTVPVLSRANPHSLVEFLAKQDQQLAVVCLKRLNDFYPTSKTGKAKDVLRRIDKKTLQESKQLVEHPFRFKEYIGLFERPLLSPPVRPVLPTIPKPANPTIRFPSRQIVRDVPLFLSASRSITIKSVRDYSTVVDNRVAALSSKIPDTKSIDLAAIMKDLTDLQNLDVLRGSTLKSGSGYKDAQRALYPLFHTKLDDGEKFPVTFAELKTTLPSIYTLAWTTISERLLEKKVSKLSDLSKEDKASLAFLQIFGVGPRYAEKFVAAGAKTLATLPEKVKLTRAQLIGLKHLEDIGRLIPRKEMDKLSAALDTAVKSADPKFQSAILGSYRRGVAFSSDIDLVIRHKDFDDADDLVLARTFMEKLITQLEKEGLVCEENAFTNGPKKYSGLIKLPRHKHFRRIDIRLCPDSSYPYILLGGSGDALLMKLLRYTAKQKGMTLNEYGMGKKYDPIDKNPNGFQPGTLKVVKNEEEIFALLGFPYLKPEERDYVNWRPIFLRAGIDLSKIEKL